MGGKNNHLEIVTSVRKLCAEFNVLFKLNTVVNSFNVDEDMTNQVTALAPVRWKVFQCLAIEAENKGRLYFCTTFLLLWSKL